MNPAAPDMISAALSAIAEAGVVGALLVRALLAIGVLYRGNQRLHELARTDKGEAVKALTDSAVAQAAVARALEQHSSLLQQTPYRIGGGPTK